jgi:hypothetical protein
MNPSQPAPCPLSLSLACCYHCGKYYIDSDEKAAMEEDTRFFEDQVKLERKLEERKKRDENEKVKEFKKKAALWDACVTKTVKNEVEGFEWDLLGEQGNMRSVVSPVRGGKKVAAKEEKRHKRPIVRVVAQKNSDKRPRGDGGGDLMMQSNVVEKRAKIVDGVKEFHVSKEEEDSLQSESGKEDAAKRNVALSALQMYDDDDDD